MVTLWKYPAANQVLSSPAVVDRVVYADDANGNVFALNANTGALI